MKTFDELPDQDPETSSAGIGLNDVIRMLFKHKWKLMLFTLLGLGAAAAIYLNHRPEYESTSKIFVRYVEEVSNVDPNEDGVVRASQSGESVINAEVEILRSWDLATEVVDEVTPAVILGKDIEPLPSLAAQKFIAGLEVVPPKNSRVITVTFRHADPEVTVRALNALVKLYREKHVEIHRATKSRETSRSRRAALTAKLTELTEQIEKLKSDNGISSLPEAAAGLNRRSDEIRSDAARAEVELAEQKARVSELRAKGLITEGEATDHKESPAGTPDVNEVKPDRAVHLQYQALIKQLTKLQDEEMSVLSTFSRESTNAKAKRREIQEAEAQRSKLEAAHPSLVQVGPAITAGAPLPPSIDPMVETVRLATLIARVELLQKRQDTLKEEFKQFAVISKRIHDLERERDLQTEGLKHFAGNFQRTEFETPLTAEQYDNIVVLQTSSPPVLALSKLMKVVAGVGLGGIALGFGLVALAELVFNRSIKRPLELETRSGIPLMLNIPAVSAKERKALRNRTKVNGSKELVVTTGLEPWAGGHFMRPYAEAIRDRLVLHFEQIGLTRKPKLVAVTSYSKGAGVSTIASGIAAALSETGDGKVLLVNMNVAHAEVHSFFEGKPAATLTDALESGGKIESLADNLYLATAANSSVNSGTQLFPKRFYDLMPNFQASDFDYIIFDMPPMDESSLALAMSGYVDKTLLVVEAEKDNRDALKRASAELLRARCRLSGILNKSRTYGPKWLQEA
jgi:polysaccharide biosynthesis transport protein